MNKQFVAAFSVAVALFAYLGCDGIPTNLRSIGAPPDIDLEKMTIGGYPLDHLTPPILEHLWGKASRIRPVATDGGTPKVFPMLDRPSTFEMCFYDKGVYFQGLTQDIDTREERAVPAYLSQITIYVAPRWHNVQKSIYTPFSGTISFGFDASTTRRQLARTFGDATVKDFGLGYPGARNDQGGTIFTFKAGQSASWSKELWEVVNLQERIENAIGMIRVEHNDGRGIAMLYYDMETSRLVWLTVAQYFRVYP